MNDLPFDAVITSHGLFEQPLDLSDIELAAVRAGIPFDYERFEAQR